MGIYSNYINEAYLDRDINLQILDEAYVGKTPILIEAENQIGIIRNSIKRGQDINAKPEVQKFNRLMEKQFGMEIFALNIDQANEINGSTQVIGMNFDIALEQNVSKLVQGSQESGYRFKPNNGLCIIVNCFYGVFTSKEITNEEIMAMFLHEIGHNFADCIYEKIRIYNKKIVKDYYEYLILNCTRRKAKKFIEENSNENAKKEAKRSSKKNRLRGIIKLLAAKKYDFSAFCSGVFNRLFCKDVQSLTNQGVNTKTMHKEMSTNLDRANELFADKFAGVYGYGPAQVSGLNKMDAHKSSSEKFLDKFCNGKEINDSFTELIQQYYLYDVHPHNIQRANSILKSLKADLAKEDMDPKLKEVLKKQVEEIEKAIENMTTYYKNEDERTKIRKAFYKMVNEKTPDGITDELEDEIQDAFDDALKKN